MRVTLEDNFLYLPRRLRRALERATTDAHITVLLSHTYAHTLNTHIKTIRITKSRSSIYSYGLKFNVSKKKNGQVSSQILISMLVNMEKLTLIFPDTLRAPGVAYDLSA